MKMNKESLETFLHMMKEDDQMILLLFVFGVGCIVGGWVVWRDLYWQHKSYFDKIRERERWKKS